MAEFKVHLDQTINPSHETVSNLLRELESGATVTLLGFDLTIEDFEIDRGPKDERLIATEMGVTVLLDTQLTEALIEEGIAREVVNRIQNLRKDSGLNVSDRIRLQIVGPEKLAKAVNGYLEYVTFETLAEDVQVDAGGGEMAFKYVGHFQIESMACIISLEKMDS
jgi:isoleucyl-tRNA synthetase